MQSAADQTIAVNEIYPRSFPGEDFHGRYIFRQVFYFDGTRGVYDTRRMLPVFAWYTQRKKKESLVTKPSLLKESLIIPEESMHFIRRSSLIFW